MNLAKLKAIAAQLDGYVADYPYAGWIAAGVFLLLWAFT